MVSRIVQLAQTISTSVSQIDQVLTAQGLPPLSFDEDLPAGYLPKELSRVRDAVIDATAELHDLLLEPLHLVKAHTRHNNAVSFQAIARYNIAAMIPPHRSTSFTDIGSRTGLGTQMTSRLLRHAMTMRIFHEPTPGTVSHTRASRMLASPEMNAWMRIGTEEMWPAATKMISALEKWGPDNESPNKTAYSLLSMPTFPSSVSLPYSEDGPTQQPASHNGHKRQCQCHTATQCQKDEEQEGASIYTTLAANPAKAALFASAMAVWSTRQDYSPEHVINGYDWDSLPFLFTIDDPEGNRVVSQKRRKVERNIKVLDVGGARGHVAIALAEKFPHLDITVWDMPAVVEGAEDDLPEWLKGRVGFVGRDLFPEASRVVEGEAEKADVVFLRWVFHNWGDGYCVHILRGLVPVMRGGDGSGQGTRVLIMDTCMPDPEADIGSVEHNVKVPLWMERDLRSEDLNMAAIFNSRERTLREWEALFQQADDRFVFKSVTKPEGSALSMMEVVWTPCL
ncbi:6-hydroxytryprostatin B O-methyltransferase [Rhypophila decipiens]|uniref:6-hydroxytryprostatin B O-methyltransferase n=1 Tax=Rhypophila decipiens TaxID=261697 RepID=A0AAN6XZH0_9PEZI|nr:6-hydroxytryprostatin B O-methyltransferase [Rhypophila decipiens]